MKNSYKKWPRSLQMGLVLSSNKQKRVNINEISIPMEKHELGNDISYNLPHVDLTSLPKSTLILLLNLLLLAVFTWHQLFLLWLFCFSFTPSNFVFLKKYKNR